MAPAERQLSTDVRMRPRLRRELALSSDVLLERLGAGLRGASCRCAGNVLGNQLELLVKREHRHFWSPWFSAQVEPLEDGRALIFGRFGPSPSLWTAIAAGYAMLGFGIFVGLMLGASQWLAERSPWGLYLVPVFLALAAGIYFAALAGRRLAREQIGWMLQLIDCSIEVGGEKRECTEGSRCAACPLWSPPAHPSDDAAQPTREA